MFDGVFFIQDTQTRDACPTAQVWVGIVGAGDRLGEFVAKGAAVPI